MTAEDPLSLEHQVCFALTVASRSIVAAYKPVLDPLGITHPQYLVMLAIWEHERLSLGSLAALLHQDASTLSPLIKRLEQQGLLARQRSAADERRLDITLTDAGRALRTRALEVPAQMAQRLDMTEAELHELHASMIHLINASRRSIGEPPVTASPGE